VKDNPQEHIDMPQLLIATNNKGKVVEIRHLLADLNLELVTPIELGIHLEVDEDGHSYSENASKKARAFAEASGLISLADDSGLEVDALGGKPGLHSNRFGPQPGTDASRRQFLLDQLKTIPHPWTAQFVATVAVTAPGKVIKLAKGECRGEIIPEERGDGGFGYDPIFLFPSLGHTMAELSLEEKNQVSHRAIAIKNSIDAVKEFMQNNR
jgi:XTP/dITP diphosphohydrolase